MCFGKYLQLKGEGVGGWVGASQKQLKPSNMSGMHSKHQKQYDKGHSIERETEQPLWDILQLKVRTKTDEENIEIR